MILNKFEIKRIRRNVLEWPTCILMERNGTELFSFIGRLIWFTHNSLRYIWFFQFSLIFYEVSCLFGKRVFFLSLYQVKAFGLNGCNMIHSKDFSIICKFENDGNRRTRNHFFNFFFLYFSILNMLLVLKSFKTMHQLVYGMRQILQYVALRV